MTADKVRNRPRLLVRVLWLLAALWTLAIAISAVWNARLLREAMFEAAVTDARSDFDQDTLYRRWAMLHGGVYVPVTPLTPPNPYLTNIVERDLVTPSGRRLTLINPDYMTRQVHELEAHESGRHGHISSLKPVRPENAPDAWETAALRAFEQGRTEVSSRESYQGRPYLRLMKPLITRAACLTCHAAQGYHEGDIRGGISEAVPLAPYLAMEKGRTWHIAGAHVGLWFLGALGIFFGGRQMRQRFDQQLAAQLEIEHQAAFARFNPNPVLELSAAGEINYANDAAAEMARGLGLENPAQMLPPNTAAMVRECLAADESKLRVETESGERVISWSFFPVKVSNTVHCYAGDITERKRVETYNEMGREILQVLNEPGDMQDSIQRVFATLKRRTGFDAVGIRLKDGDDFPYFAQQGFSKDFLLTENTLVERAADGGVCRDKDGNIRLECTCGLVISGKTDPANPFFTRGGSFWTNDSFPLLNLPPDQDPRLHPRNQCIHQGYASVALVPIRDKDRIVGLIQLNDRRKGCFTLNTVELMEEIAAHIGEALMRKRAEEKIQELSRAVEQSPASIVITDPAGNIEYVNPKFAEVTGYAPAEVLGKNPRLLKSGKKSPEAYRELWETITAGKEWRGEFHNRKKNGELYWESASISPIRDFAGRITHYVAVKEDITARKQTEAERERLVQDLQRVLALVKSLSGLLPICAGCKKIRDDKGYWTQVESYIQKHSEATFTHGLCPDCIKKYYPELGEVGTGVSPQETT